MGSLFYESNISPAWKRGLLFGGSMYGVGKGFLFFLLYSAVLCCLPAQPPASECPVHDAGLVLAAGLCNCSGMVQVSKAICRPCKHKQKVVQCVFNGLCQKVVDVLVVHLHQRARNGDLYRVFVARHERQQLFDPCIPQLAITKQCAVVLFWQCFQDCC